MKRVNLVAIETSSKEQVLQGKTNSRLRIRELQAIKVESLTESVVESRRRECGSCPKISSPSILTLSPVRTLSISQLRESFKYRNIVQAGCVGRKTLTGDTLKYSGTQGSHDRQSN